MACDGPSRQHEPPGAGFGPPYFLQNKRHGERSHRSPTLGGLLHLASLRVATRRPLDSSLLVSLDSLLFVQHRCLNRSSLTRVHAVIDKPAQGLSW